MSSPNTRRGADGARAGTQLRSLQMLRAIAALLVVMFHTQTIFGERAGLDVFGGVFAHGSRGVDLFFVLSGFVITYVHLRDCGQPRRLGNYLYNRISRIYPSVWIVGALALAAYLLGPALGVAVGMDNARHADKLQTWNIVASLLLLPQQGTALVNVTWTLKYEMFFYLVFALLIVDRRLLILLILWQAAVLGCLLGHISFEGSWVRYYLGPLSLEFGIGMVCAWLTMHRAAWTVLASRALQMAGLLLGTAIFVGGAMVETYSDSRVTVPDLVIYGASSGLIVLSLALLEMSGRLWSSRLLLYLGNASYAIYLVHFSVVMQVSGALLRLGFVPMNNATYAAVAIVGVLVGIAFHRLIDQPIQRALRRLRHRLLEATGGPRRPDPGTLMAGFGPPPPETARTSRRG